MIAVSLRPTIADRSKRSKPDASLFAPSRDNVDKPGLGVVELEEYPVHVVRDAIESGVIVVVLFADARLTRHDFAKPVEIVSERVRVASAEPRFDLGRNSIRIVDKADGIDDAAHTLGLCAAHFSSSLQFGRERARAFDEPSMPDIG
jgi:hypothetical protein